MKRFTILLVLAAGVCIGGSGCGDDADPLGVTTQGAEDLSARATAAQLTDDALLSVTLRFAAAVGPADFACGRLYPSVGQSRTAVTPRDFRFLVESVRLIDEQGREVPVALDTRAPWQTPEVALIDFADAACGGGTPETNLTITGRVPVGRYRGVVFVNGVPEKLNHADPTFAPPPLAHPGLS